MGLNDTHNPKRTSWVKSANAPDCDFPIQNLPYGVFATDDGPHVGVAIGDSILDLTALEFIGVLQVADAPVFNQGTLNPLMAQPQSIWAHARQDIAALLDAENPMLREDAALCGLVLVPQAGAQMLLPFFVRSFTDFYASKEHATNVGTMFRDPENALIPNWLHIPIGYNGRASTVVVSGTEIYRPMGQLKGPSDDTPRFGPTAKLDIELELGAVVGTPNEMGQPVSTETAYDMIFGYVLMNDWSARDVQVWEYQPLGPFQSKAFATSISPWVVTREALEPFRAPTPEREVPLLPYLAESSDNNFDINLSIEMSTGGDPQVISQTNYRGMYYSAAQQLAHHTTSGCAMCTGDLLGSGTISGQTPNSYGSLLELTWNGRDPIDVNGQPRTFVEDGDTITLRGHCERDYRIGFGNCTGTIKPSRDAV